MLLNFKYEDIRDMTCLAKHCIDIRCSHSCAKWVHDPFSQLRDSNDPLQSYHNCLLIPRRNIIAGWIENDYLHSTKNLAFTMKILEERRVKSPFYYLFSKFSFLFVKANLIFFNNNFFYRNLHAFYWIKPKFPFNHLYLLFGEWYFLFYLIPSLILLSLMLNLAEYNLFIYLFLKVSSSQLFLFFISTS